MQDRNRSALWFSVKSCENFRSRPLADRQTPRGPSPQLGAIRTLGVSVLPTTKPSHPRLFRLVEIVVGFLSVNQAAQHAAHGFGFADRVEDAKRNIMQNHLRGIERW
jgi:hypothetical protein